MKKFSQKFCTVAVAGVMSVAAIAGFVGCTPEKGDSSGGSGSSAVQTTYSLDFSEQVESWTKETVSSRNISYYTASAVYCKNPTNSALQRLVLYAPEGYFNADGTINKAAKVGNYTAETAPVIYINTYSGYQGYAPYTLDAKETKAGTNGWYYDYLENGFVICFVGERGINATNSEKQVIGRGAVGVADLKAGIRFLKHNSDKIPGNTDRIISNGVSAGGAMSALLGVSGNSDCYDEYLEAMGACMDETDDVYATQAYCPIMDLEYAPLAYEWMWSEQTSTMTAFTQAMSDKMIVAYAEYINGLSLADENGNSLTLDGTGAKSGSFYDWLIEKYEISYEQYVALNGTTADAERYDWLSYDEETGKATLSAAEGYGSALDALLADTNTRYKSCVAFDDLEYGYYGDNGVFGRQNTKASEEGASRHFSIPVTEIMATLQEEYPEEYAGYYQAYYDESHNEEVRQVSQIINPYHFIADEGTDTSRYFRINVGTADPHTSPTVSAGFALLLQRNGIDVEYNLMWKQVHTDADVAGGFIDWVNSICE